MVQQLAPDATERNYARLPLLRKEVDLILKAAEDVEEVMNTRHKRVKAEGWKDRAPSKTVFAKAVVEENNLLRRPILVHGGRLVVGRDLEGIRSILASRAYFTSHGGFRANRRTHW